MSSEGFVTLNSSDSYRRAKKLLAQRFGDPHRVSDAYKTRLRKWQQISERHSSDLQAFSDFLIQCEEAMKSIKFLDDLDSTEVLKLVSSKLPSYSGVKWCRHAFEVKKKYGRAVTFRDIVKFVETEADLATDPVFSPDVLKEERKKVFDKNKILTNRRRPPNATNANSFATSTAHFQRNSSPAYEPKISSKVCPVCSKTHGVHSCDELKMKSPEERHNLIQSAGLCFGCLGNGHYSKNCRKRLTCHKCGKPHPTILHYDPKDDKEPRSQEKIEAHESHGSSGVSSVCRHTIGDRASVTNSMIIPVWLHHKDNPQKEVLVYALLDDASDTTFIKSQTLRDLGLSGPEIKLSLHTMLGKEEITVEKANDLVVKRMDKRVEVELPKAYSRTRIPHRKNQIPIPEVASKWPHLNKIAERLHPYQSNTDVALLIGCNCPRAIKPREVILGKGDDPYAVRTLLGWGIVGPVTPHQESQEEDEAGELATCNRIMSREIGKVAPSNLQFIPVVQSKEEISPYTAKKMFEMDFSERALTAQALSKEDRKFLTIVEEGLRHCEDGHYEMPLPLRVPNPAESSEQSRSCCTAS